MSKIIMSCTISKQADRALGKAVRITGFKRSKIVDGLIINYLWQYMKRQNSADSNPEKKSEE